MKHSKICIAAIAVSIAVALGGCTNYNKLMEETPVDYISTASENSMKSILSKDSLAIAKQISDASENGSVRIDITDGDMTHSLATNQNTKQKEFAAGYTVSCNGVSYSFAGGADEKRLYLASEGESGSYAYYLDTENMSKGFEDSVFYYDSGSRYALSKEVCDAITEQFDNISEKSSKKENDYEKYSKKIMKVLNKTEHTFSTEKVQVGDKDVRAHVISYDLDEEEISDVIADLNDIIIEMSEETGADNAGSIKSSLDDISRAVDGSGIKLRMNFYINSRTHVLMMSDMKATVSDGSEQMTVSAELFLGEDPSKTSEYYLKMKFSEGGESASVNLTVTDESEKDNIKYTAALKVKGGGSDSVDVKGTFEYSKKSKEYTAELRVPMDDEAFRIKLSGTINPSRTDVEITADSVSCSLLDEKLRLKAAVTYSSKQAALPDGSKAVDIWGITEKEIDSLSEDIANDIKAVFLESEDSLLGSEIGDSLSEAAMASSNANAKQIYSALAEAVPWLSVQGYTLYATDDYYIRGTVTNAGNGTIHIEYEDNVNNIPDSAMDLASYLGEDFKGVGYFEADPYSYSVNYALWSDKEIPAEYRHQLTEEELKEANKKQKIGCYPVNYYYDY